MLKETVNETFGRGSRKRNYVAILTELLEGSIGHVAKKENQDYVQIPAHFEMGEKCDSRKIEASIDMIPA